MKKIIKIELKNIFQKYFLNNFQINPNSIANISLTSSSRIK